MDEINQEKNLESEWMNSKEVAIYLRFLKPDGSPDSSRVRSLVHQGRLPFYKPFGRLIFKRTDIKKLVEDTFEGAWKWR